MLDQYKTVLAEAGMTMDDLVSVQVFCSDVVALRHLEPGLPDLLQEGFPRAGLPRLGSAAVRGALRGAGVRRR